jgi:hydroxymethylbilane synthase
LVRFIAGLPSRHGAAPLDTRIRIGARASRLSLIQVDEVRRHLHAARPGLTIEIIEFITSGDRQLETPLPLLGGKGVFTEEIEEALRGGEVDLAGHTQKDLPVESPPGLVIGGIPPRADVADVLISRSGKSLAELPAGTTVGTSSVRRAAQLLRARPDLQPVSIRGNVETRLRKVLSEDGDYGAIVLARAGLDRLDRTETIAEVLPLELMLPAPGQGALAVQCRAGDPVLAQLALIHDRAAAIGVTAERAFLAGLGGGCSAPVAGFGQLVGDALELRGRVISPDGSITVETQTRLRCRDEETARIAGKALAQEALAKGAGKIVGALR